MKRLTKIEKERLLKEKLSSLKKLNNKRNEIIGIDLGTQITGFYSKNIGSKVLKDPSNTDRNSRIYHICKEINGLLLSIDYNSVIVFMEDYSFGLRHSSLAQLAELGGVIKNLLIDFKIPYYLVAPLTLKKFVLGPKNKKQEASNKARIMVEILDRWKVKFTDDNAADSFALYKFGLSLMSFANKPDIKKSWEQQMFKDFIVNRT